jgi:hypothetical protein
MNDQQPVTKAELLEALRGLEDRGSTTRRPRSLAQSTAAPETGDLRLRRLETAEICDAERIARLEAGGLWAPLELRIIELEKRIGKQP